MYIKSILLGIAFFVSMLNESDGSNKCYRAKICIHDGKEKCGQNAIGEVRRFLDSCDMKEYNCLKSTNFKKTNKKLCRKLPSLEKKVAKEDKEDDHNEVKIDANESKAVNDDKKIITKPDQASQEIENDEVNNDDQADKESKEIASHGESTEEKSGGAGEDRVRASKEDADDKESKEDRSREANTENQTDDMDDENEGTTETQKDVIDEENKEDEDGTDEEDPTTKGVKADRSIEEGGAGRVTKAQNSYGIKKQYQEATDESD